MDLLFKHPNDANPDSKDIVGETDFKNYNPAVHKNMRWATLRPYIRQATKDYILPFVGKAMYDAIVAKVDDNPDDEQTEVIEHLKDAIAYYTDYLATRGLNVSLADLGAQQQSATEGTSGPPSQWSFKDHIWHCLSKGDEYLDKALNHMEDQVIALNAFYDPWKTSVNYEKRVSELFRTTADLDNYINIQNNRRSYVAMVPWLRLAEENHLKTILCTDTFIYVSDLIKSGGGNDLEKELINLSRRVVAYKAVELGVPQLSVVIDGDGFKVVTQVDGFDRRVAGNTEQQLKAQTSLQYHSQEQWRQAQSNLLRFLFDNKDTFTDWAASSCCGDNRTEGRTVIVGKENRGGVFL